MLRGYVGWKVLVLVHIKRTIRKYEEILGIDVRELFAEEGPSAMRSIGYQASSSTSPIDEMRASPAGMVPLTNTPAFTLPAGRQTNIWREIFSAVETSRAARTLVTGPIQAERNGLSTLEIGRTESSSGSMKKANNLVALGTRGSGGKLNCITSTG